MAISGYRSAKRWGIWLALFLMAPFLFQCATASASSRTELEKRVDELAQSNAELQARVGELERKLSLLESALKAAPAPEPGNEARSSTGAAAHETGDSPSAGSAATPPPGLAVLKLTPPNAPSPAPHPGNGGAPASAPGESDPNAPAPLFDDDPGFVDAPEEITNQPAPSSPGNAPGEGISVEAATLYESALGQYQKGELELAAEAFELYLTKYPDNSYAPNALFYLGECYYAKHSYQKGMEQYRRLLMKFPESEMAPDALFKMGMCFIMLNDEKSARQAFKRVMDNYPFSEAARSAEAQLKKMQ